MIERMVVLSTGDSCDLPPDFLKKSDWQVRQTFCGEIRPLSEYIAERERAYLVAAYRQCGTTRGAAQALGIDHSTFIRKIKRYGICATR